MNVFKKCLRKEFGKKGYVKYVKLFSEEIGDKKNVRLVAELLKFLALYDRI